MAARFGTEKFAEVIPSELAEQIVAAYHMHSRDVISTRRIPAAY